MTPFSKLISNFDHFYCMLDRKKNGFHFAEGGYRFDTTMALSLYESVTGYRPSIVEGVGITNYRLDTKQELLIVDCHFKSPVIDELNMGYSSIVRDWF